MDLNFDSIATVVSGGVTGVVGAGLSRVADYLSEKQRNLHNLEMAKIQIDSIARESESRISEIKALDERGREIPVATEEISAVASESFRETELRWSKSRSKWFIFVDVLRGVIRPVLTMQLCLMCFIVWLSNRGSPLEQQIVLTILYMATTATLWWFGTRPSSGDK